MSEPAELESRCELLRSLQVPGDPVVLAECLGRCLC